MLKILNIMLSRDLGGIQQAFIDYNDIIKAVGFEAILVTSTNAKVNAEIEGEHYTLPNYCSFDPFSKYKLKKIVESENPDLIIAHGKRAIKFALSTRKSSSHKVIIIGVAHNYRIESLLSCDYILSITTHLKNYLISNGYRDNKIFLMPNAIDIKPVQKLTRKKFTSKKIIIGTLARFVHKKGIDVFIKALSILKDQGIEFEAKIGGAGEELGNIKMLIKDLNLQDCINLIGWVKDKAKFFDEIDIFCLPSRHEPFGIIILETMLHKVPIVSTKSEGPVEILTPNEAMLVDIDSPEQIAEKISFLVKNKDTATSLSERAFLRVAENYGIKHSALRLETYIKKILKNDI